MTLPAPPALVDVLLATYNGERHLRAQLDSLLAQTHQNFRLLVSDDGSRDGTRALLESYRPRLGARLRLLDNPAPGRGVVRNFEYLMQTSLDDGVADCAAFCDQDDVWLPGKLAALLAALQQLQGEGAGPGQAPPPCLVHCDLAVVDAALAPIHPSFVRHQGLEPARCDTAALLSINQVTGCAALVNRALLALALPLPPAVLMHDWWCALLASAAGRRHFIDRPLVLYRQHGGNQLGAQPRTLAGRLARLRRDAPGVLRRARALGQGTLDQAAALRQRLAERGAQVSAIDGYLAWRRAPWLRRWAASRAYYPGPALERLARLLLWR